jgi:hypothetical protein
VNINTIESYASFVLLGLGVVIFFAWLVDVKKQEDKRRREEELMPLVGVVLPKKKDEDANE